MDDIPVSLGMTKIVFYIASGSKDKLIESILEGVTNLFLHVDALQIEKYGDRLNRYLGISRHHEDSARILLLQMPYDEKYKKQFKKLSRQLNKRTKSRIEKRQKLAKPKVLSTSSLSMNPSYRLS